MKVKELQEVYRQAGYTNVKVLIPAQKLTNGIVHLQAVIRGSNEDVGTALNQLRAEALTSP